MKAEASNQKISWFQREFEANTLNLSPEFQRNPVWTEEEASHLIDTVLLELPFPEVYLRSKTSAKGKTHHEVVDGQQRIRSLLRFGANDLELRGDEVSSKFIGKTFEDLPKVARERFWNYSVVVRDLGSASDAEIRDLFRRLNRHSVVLNDQELRNAKYRGHFIKLMEELADDPWWIDMRIVTPRQVRRMEDIEFVSELFIGAVAGPQNKKDTLDDYYDAHEKEFEDKEKQAKLFRDTRALIADTLSADQVVDWSGKSDFYALFIAFSYFVPENWTAKKKRNVAACLATFRKDVDVAKKKGAEIKDKKVAMYVEAVTRAASDSDRRKTRVNLIMKLIESATD